ncbi:hypothetical protein [Bremerella alba]|uniref:Uncharacterized protein n=1 Tax=Bremerella alba TaxID=980252 RepID=A0A7V8V6E1_9BACT|nr:hypothetical protein [Bremerella alba]MBA2115711.1 hypothetical protein [Bremerella alba]
MIVKSQNVLIDTDSIAFAVMYRCLKCDNVVHGTKGSANGIVCENCQSPLEEDDEIAFRLEGDD